MFDCNNRIVTFAVCVLCMSAGLAAAADVDREALGKLDITTVIPDHRENVRKMLGYHTADRLREANRRETAAWNELHSQADWDAYVKPRIERMRTALNVPDDIGHRPPLAAKVTRTLSGDGWTVDNIAFESRPGLVVTANLYRPAKPLASMPGILLSHSHHNPKTEGELREMGVSWARAGCYVLVPDHLGHGERREHAFSSAEAFAKQFRVGRQDYYFRCNSSLQLYATGESLMGWMVYDLSRGVDLLLSQPGIDANRIALLGSVAGGGDPAAVAAALDTRIKAVAPFNFGGPQPETRYPLPENAESWFNYAGGGSWESTRNLYRSAADGFLPWVIVGSIAPRTLIYGHEFSWDREHDPVWRRLETIWGWYGAKDRLASAHGKGTITGKSPEPSHCNNIGRIQRREVAAALKQTLNIPEPIYRDGDLPKTADLLVFPEAKDSPARMRSILAKSADEQLRKARETLAPLNAEQRPKQVQALWKKYLGKIDPPDGSLSEVAATDFAGATVTQYLLQADYGIAVPLTTLRVAGLDNARRPAVVLFARAGKQKLLTARRDEIAAMLNAGVVVCLADLRGFGESASGASRDRGSDETSIAASCLMLGDPLIAAQLRDLRFVIGKVRQLPYVDMKRIALWGDSLTPANAKDVVAAVPLDLDQPTPAEPVAATLALLGGLFDDVSAVYARGGLAHFRDLLDSPYVHVPLAAIVPGAIAAGDVPELVSALPAARVRQDATVDAWNRQIDAPKENIRAADWIIRALRKP
jgi:cephalosporin-C deacetylase-like acetyl esterase